jgi:hypothetical protein
MGVLLDQLNSAKGLGGRRRKVKSGSERARVSVTTAISRAIEKSIRPDHPALAGHFDRFLQTGTSLRYAPDPDVVWDL